MPTKPKRYSDLLRESRPMRPAPEQRGTAAQRGYDARWRRFRAWFLADAAHCACADCGVAPSVDVHHVQPCGPGRTCSTK